MRTTRRKDTFANTNRRYSLRKLSVGLASVLIGLSFISATKIQTVKADSLNQAPVYLRGNENAVQNEKKQASSTSSSVAEPQKNLLENTENNQIEAKNQENRLADQSNNKLINQDSTNSNQDSGQNLTDPDEAKQDAVTKNDAEKGIIGSGSLQDPDNHSEDSSQAQPQNSQKLNLTKNSKKFARKVLATNLIATPPMTNGGFDEATWGKLDVNDWQGSVQNGVYQLTNYNGDLSHVIVPNEADFEQAGKSTNGLQVGITRDTINSLISRTFQDQTIAFSKTSGQKVKAIGTDWSNAFSAGNKRSYLNNFDGSNLDISNVTNMARMFNSDSISDLTSLTNWDTSKVTDMSGMFSGDYTRDLTGLANWDVSNVTNMSDMFSDNDSISDLTGLANWDVSNVTNMSSMFSHDYSISDLTGLAHWKTSNVTNMSHMFDSNSLNDLTPLKHWNTSKVTDMSYMFDSASVGDLSPLANWDTSNVTNMSCMFNSMIFGAGINKISDLTPLANWNVNKVTDMSHMFSGNTVSNLTSLANWNISNVINMGYMFWKNKVSDLTPLANWNVSNVRNMGEMFEDNSLNDLRPLANWDTGKVVNMGEMFEHNSISDLTPLTNWNTSNVANMSGIFAGNPDLIDLKPIANWNISDINDYYGRGFSGLFSGDTKLDLTNINNTPLMQSFLKKPIMLIGSTFIINNVDFVAKLVKATTGKDVPILTNTAKRTITFNIPNATPETIVQTINYKAVAPVQVNFPVPEIIIHNKLFFVPASIETPVPVDPDKPNPVDPNGPKIIKTYPLKDSDWQLDTSKQNDAIIVNGQIRFKPVKIPHVNGYKAYIMKDPVNPTAFLVSFMALPKQLQNNQSNNIQLSQKETQAEQKQPELVQTRPAEKQKQPEPVQIINHISYPLMHDTSGNADSFEPAQNDSAPLEVSSDSTQKDDAVKPQKVNAVKHKKHIVKKRAVNRRRKHAKKYHLKRRSRKHTKRVKKHIIKHRKCASRKFRKYNLKHIKKA